MRHEDHFTSTVEGAAGYARHYGQDGHYDDQPTADEVAITEEERAHFAAQAAHAWTVGVDRCPPGRLTILPLRGTTGWVAVCRDEAHNVDRWADTPLISPTGSRAEARAFAVAHHERTQHPYSQALPLDPPSF